MCSQESRLSTGCRQLGISSALQERQKLQMKLYSICDEFILNNLEIRVFCLCLKKGTRTMGSYRVAGADVVGK